MELKDLEQLVKTRRSIRKWQDKPVPEDLITKALELATWAPNAGNQQNWFFYVIYKRDTINAIADKTQEIANQVSKWLEEEKSDWTERWKHSAGLFRSAPVLIAVVTTQYHVGPDKIIAEKAKTDPKADMVYKWRMAANSRIQTVGSAVATMLLAFQQMGLGAVWMTGPMQAKGEIEKVLGLPSDKDVVALIPVGYPAETPEVKPRKPVSEISKILK
jgi:nitroreductase